MFISIFTGLAFILLGIYALAYPIYALSTLSIYISISLIIYGIYRIIRSIQLHRFSKYWWVLLLEGISGVLGGILLMTFPGYITLIILWFTALNLIGIAIRLFKRKRNDGTHRAKEITLGILLILLTIFIINRPIYTDAFIIVFIGISSVVHGIHIIYDFFKQK